MRSVSRLLENAMTESIAKSFPSLSSMSQSNPSIRAALAASVTPSVKAHSAATTKGVPHYQCNSAMPLYKAIRSTGIIPEVPLASVAESILQHIPSGADMIGAAWISGAGFINLSLSPRWLASEIERTMAGIDATQGTVSLGEPVLRRRVVIDYSSPNVAKEMHVGHLRSTVIGDALGYLLEYSGHSVTRVNHVGDWGTQFGMILASLVGKAHDDVIGLTNEDLETLYREAKRRFEGDEGFRSSSHAWVRRLQAGDREALRIWAAVCGTSRRAFQDVYRRLGVSPLLTERGESAYAPYIAETLAELKAKNLVEESDGCLCVFDRTGSSKSDFPLILVKSDGAFTYDTTDVTALRLRVAEGADWLIYVTDNGQKEHFDRIFRLARQAGWSTGVATDHVGFGVVTGADGKRLRTRMGGTVKLRDLLDEAEARASNMCAASPPGADPLLSSHIAMGALKFGDLKLNRGSDYRFDFDKALDPKGDTAVYVLYSLVRLRSVLRHAEPRLPHPPASVVFTHVAEQELCLQILRFPECVEAAVSDLAPNRLCLFALALAEKVNAFYRDCPVSGKRLRDDDGECQASRDQVEGSRRVIVRAAEAVLETSLRLLGIRSVQHM